MIKSNVISKINNALSTSKPFVKLERTNMNIQLAQCLLNLNKIEKFCLNNTNIILFFIYNGFWFKKSKLGRLSLIKAKLSVSFNNFKNISNFNKNVIFNTPFGLLTKEYAILYKTGGFPLCIFD
jgi:ribosomal protein S8